MLTESKYSENPALLLAGMFEVGGLMQLQLQYQKKQFVHTKKTYPQVYPKLEVSSTNPLMKDLEHKFGGHSFNIGHAIRYVLRGSDCIPIARQMRPFCPARRKVIDAIISWGNGLTFEEQQILADADFNQSDHAFSDTNPQDYVKLVSEPLFLLGITIIRKGIHPDQNSIDLGTYNRGLLEAMRDRFPGHIRPVVKPVGKPSRLILGPESSHEFNNLIESF